MDNASVHRSKKNERICIKEKLLSIAYIPACWPEMVPVQKYFSMLKRVVTKQSYGLQINWKSKESRALL